MLVKFKHLESTIKDVIAGNQGASRNIVSASKPTFYALKIVNAWAARTLKEVKKEELSIMKTTIPWPTCSRLMQPSVGPLDPLVMGPLWCPEKERATNSILALQIKQLIQLNNLNRYIFLQLQNR